MPHHTIPQLYKKLTKLRNKPRVRDMRSEEIANALQDLIFECRSFLSGIPKVYLRSNIPGKRYFVFKIDGQQKSSRPVNDDLYYNNLDIVMLKSAMSCNIGDLTADELTQIIYNATISYCCWADLTKSGDQKTPGTFFEILIGHIVANGLNANPGTELTVPTLGVDVTIPTDYVFDLGEGKNWVHLPIKLSTRERVIQVWAHQRVLDGMHGVARFKGALVVMAETNKNTEDMSVADVCLPDQWSVYQMYISQLYRIYYLDIPGGYRSLADNYPFIQVKKFGEFYREIDKIERGGSAA